MKFSLRLLSLLAPWLIILQAGQSANACEHHRRHHHNEDHDHNLDHDHGIHHHHALQSPVRVLIESDPEDVFDKASDDDDFDMDRCGTMDPTDEEIAAGNAAVADFDGNRRRSLIPKKLRDETIVIPVVVHKLLFRENIPGATNQMIADQMQVLNDAFAPFFAFDLQVITDTVNPGWYRVRPSDEATVSEMKSALHQGGPETLNMYTGRPRALGFATFPQAVKTHPELDGIVILDESMPGGRAFPYNEGDTAVHEGKHDQSVYPHSFCFVC